MALTSYITGGTLSNPVALNPTSGGWLKAADGTTGGSAPAVGDTLLLVHQQGTNSGVSKLAEGSNAAGTDGDSSGSIGAGRWVYRGTSGGATRLHVYTRVYDGTEVWPLNLYGYSSGGTLTSTAQQGFLGVVKDVSGLRTATTPSTTPGVAFTNGSYTTGADPVTSLGHVGQITAGLTAGDLLIRVASAVTTLATPHTINWESGPASVGQQGTANHALRQQGTRVIGLATEAATAAASGDRTWRADTDAGVNDLAGSTGPGSYQGATIAFVPVLSGSVPTVVANPAVATANTPAHIGDVITVASNAAFSAPGGDPVLDYTRRVVQSTDGGATWTVVTTFTANASYAALPTYTIVSGDAGHLLRYEERARNNAGSSVWAPSNSAAPVAPPTNTVAPAISPAGPYSTGQLVTCSTGTWTGSPTFAYQWFRGTSPITGETTSSYTLAVTDEGANVRCDVTATNAGGSQTTSSNTIVPAVTSPMSDASFLVYYSGGVGNTNPSASIGGARGGTYPGGLSALIGPIPGSVAASGGTFYRAVFVRNTHTITTASAAKAFIEQQFASAAAVAGLDVAVGVPPQGVNTALPVLANESTSPVDGSSNPLPFTAATTPAAGQAYGSLAPGDYRGVWLRFHADAGVSQITEDDFTVAIEATPV